MASPTSPEGKNYKEMLGDTIAAARNMITKNKEIERIERLVRDEELKRTTPPTNETEES